MDFLPTNEPDLTDGFRIWDFPELTPADMAFLQEFTCKWTEHLEGQNNPTLAKTREAMKSAKVLPVASFLQLFSYVAHFEVFMDVSLGATHAVVKEIRYLWKYLQED